MNKRNFCLKRKVNLIHQYNKATDAKKKTLLSDNDIGQEEFDIWSERYEKYGEIGLKMRFIKHARTKTDRNITEQQKRKKRDTEFNEIINQYNLNAPRLADICCFTVDRAKKYLEGHPSCEYPSRTMMQALRKFKKEQEARPKQHSFSIKDTVDKLTACYNLTIQPFNHDA